jgi:RNA polymerase sigma factor (sigma-70 family)
MNPSHSAQSANAAYRRFCERRDPSAIAELFDIAAADLRRTAMHLVGDAATADDLVQTTFMCAIESRTFDPSRDVLPWLAGILKNQASLVHRRRAKRLDAERLRLEPCEDPSVAASEWETQREVENAIAQLNDVYRPVVRLHLVHGLEAGAIAETLGRPGGTVRTQLMRGLEKLRELLPVGIAGAVAGLLPTMGTAAVRTAVLAAAGATAATTTTAAATSTVSSWSGGRLAVAALLLTAAVAAPFVWPSDDVEAPHTVTATASATVRVVPAAGSLAEKDAKQQTETASDRRQVAPMASADMQRPFEARGMVRDEEGRPAADVEVFGFVADRPFFDGTGFAPPPASAARTDANGRFALVMPTEECYLVARAPGRFCAAAVSGVAKGRAFVDGIEFDLVPTSKLVGKVVDEKGRGLDRIRITTSSWSVSGPDSILPIPDFFRAALPRIQTTTGSNGSFEATVVPKESYEWNASADGYVTSSVSHRGENGPLRITLRKGATIRGVAFRADGSPAAGAIAAIADEGGPRTRCDASGRFELRGLKEGTQHVLLLDDEKSAIHCTELSDFSREVRVQLEAPRTLAVRVVDSAGMPAAGAFVRIRGERMTGPKRYAGIEPTWEFAHRRSSTTTDDDGSFAMQRLYDGMFAIEVRLPGTNALLPLGSHRAGLPLREFRLAQALASSATLRGRAIDATTGVALSSLELVVMQRLDGGSWSGESHTPKLADGTYTLVGMNVGASRITARADGYAEMPAVEVDLRAGPQTLDVVLAPVRTLEVDAYVEGIAANGTVRIFDADGATQMLGSDRTGRSDRQPIVDGKAMLHGIPALRVRVSVECASAAPAEQWVDLSGTGPHRVRFDLLRAEPQAVAAPKPRFELGVVVMFGADASVEHEAPAALDAQWLRRIQADPRVSMPDKPIDLVVLDMQGRTLATSRISLAAGTDPATNLPRTGYSSDSRMADGVTIFSPSNSAAGAAFRLPEGRVRIEVRSEGRTTNSVDATCDASKPTTKLVMLIAEK